MLGLLFIVLLIAGCTIVYRVYRIGHDAGRNHYATTWLRARRDRLTLAWLSAFGVAAESEPTEEDKAPMRLAA